MRSDARIVARLLTAVMFVSVIGGLLLSNEWNLRAERLQVGAGKATPASPEMMGLLREEHGLVAEMIKAQLAVSAGGFASNPIAAPARRQAIAMR
jgi:hypothetical protein